VRGNIQNHREPPFTQLSAVVPGLSKRVFDIACSLFGLVVLFPVFFVLAMAVWFQDLGPVLYRAVRVGKEGRLFTLYKFRTMIPGADRKGAGITTNGDMRITQLGRTLRRFKLDELPQLLNVVKGDMSLVGPRPEDPRYVALYTPDQRRVLQVRPGITSIASLHFKDEESLLRGSEWERVYIGEILPKKLAMEIDYVSRRSNWKDLMIILRTLGGVLR
jgi:lipopolysaccharide/colanic/teichoic acid biosynthesis glycosyltransferase